MGELKTFIIIMVVICSVPVLSTATVTILTIISMIKGEVEIVDECGEDIKM